MNGDVLDLATPGSLSTPVTVLLLALVFLAPGWLLVRQLLGARRARSLARAAGAQARDAEQPLAPGPKVIHGRVELASGEATAVRVEIDQKGTESEGSGGWSFKWAEIRRRWTLRPFYVRLDDGKRVRIEPGDKAFLVDALDGVIVKNEFLRTRHAELTPGEEVFAAGWLKSGDDPEATALDYRGRSGQGWVMVPPPGGELLLSSEPLQARYARAARAHLLAASVAAAAIVVQSIVAWGTLLRLFTARNVVATVLDRRVERGDESDSYAVLVRVDDTPFWVDATPASYQGASAGASTRLTYVPSSPAQSQLGHDASGSIVVPVIGVFMLLPLLFGVWLTVERSKRWFEKELEDVGSGRLAANTETTKMK